MAEVKREEWEIDRDRLEISELLSRYRSIHHRQIADILNKRREAEYQTAIRELDALSADDPIPNLPKRYTLSRQMIDYDIRAIRREWRTRYREKYDDHISQQLAAAFELHAEGWRGYERSVNSSADEFERYEETVELKTTAAALRVALGDEFLGSGDATKKISVPGARKVKQKRKKATGFGDPRFLLVVDRAQARVDDLLQLKAPQQIDINTPGAAEVVLVQGFDPTKWEAARAATEVDRKSMQDPDSEDPS